MRSSKASSKLGVPVGNERLVNQAMLPQRRKPRSPFLINNEVVLIQFTLVQSASS